MQSCKLSTKTLQKSLDWFKINVIYSNELGSVNLISLANIFMIFKMCIIVSDSWKMSCMNFTTSYFSGFMLLLIWFAGGTYVSALRLSLDTNMLYLAAD